MGDDFLVVPAVSLKGGDVVIVRNHAYEPVEDEAGEPFAIDEFVEVFLKDFPAVLVFDIDGIEGEGAQFDEVGRLDRAAPDVWWDAGAKDHADVINVITSGADRAVVSTRSLKGYRELGKAVELTENLVFEIVLKGPVVLAGARDFRGQDPGAVARDAARAGAESFLLLDAARPLGAPLEWEAARQVGASAKSLYLGGGIDLSAARGLKGPEGLPLKGAVVDLISVLTPYL